MEDEIAESERQLNLTENPGWRDLYRKRKLAAQRRLDMLRMKFDPDALVAELEEISRAQRMATLDPNILTVMREMVGEVNDKFASYVAHFAKGKVSEVDPAFSGMKMRRERGGGEGGAEFSGAGFVDAD